MQTLDFTQCSPSPQGGGRTLNPRSVGVSLASSSKVPVEVFVLFILFP